jgi:hypothetical protein
MIDVHTLKTSNTGIFRPNTSSSFLAKPCQRSQGNENPQTSGKLKSHPNISTEVHTQKA